MPSLVGAMFISLVGEGALLAQTLRWSNPTPIAIPDRVPAAPYPSTIVVPKELGAMSGISVTISNLVYSVPDDLDMLLVGPGGEAVLLMSDAGGDANVSELTLTFADRSMRGLPDAAPLRAGVYAPSNFDARDTFAAPAPRPPYSTNLSVFHGTDPAGEWRLFIANDSGQSRGALSGGWSLELALQAKGDPPTIVSQPESQSVAAGADVVFEVRVTGTPPIGYQWLHNGRIIVPFSEGKSQLSLQDVQSSDAGTYSVGVTNRVSGFPGVTSREAILTVAPRFIQVGSLRTEKVSRGEAVTLQAAIGTNPPTGFQWFLNGKALPGQTNATLNLSLDKTGLGGEYTVLVFTEGESRRSEPTRLLVESTTAPPATDRFSERPKSTEFAGTLQGNSSLAQKEPDEPEIGSGHSVWFEWSAPARGIVTFTTQGSTFDTTLAVFRGATLDQLEKVAQDDDSGGFYTSRLQLNVVGGEVYQIAIDAFGVNAGNKGGDFNLTWELEGTNDLVPVIRTAPSSQVLSRGGNATLRVESDSPADFFQWTLNGQVIPGATGSTYEISGADSTDIGLYSVIVSNLVGRTVETEPVQVQLGAGDLVLVHDKGDSIFLPSANGNRPTQGFISIGLGGVVYTNEFYSVANREATDPDPCDEPFYGTLWLGLAATNSGLIRVETTGSQIPARLAVYQLTGGLADFDTGALVCDLTSGPAGRPCVAQFEALQGTNYTVVVEGYEAAGNLTLVSQMGQAPSISLTPECRQVIPGGNLVLEVPAVNWFPAPVYQWRRNEQDIPGATGATLMIGNFDESLAGTYSVFVSNFVGTATATVAHVTAGGPFQLSQTLVKGGGSMSLILQTSAGQPVVLEAASALGGTWLPVLTNSDPCSSLVFTNSNLTAEPWRFYRAVLRPLF